MTVRVVKDGLEDRECEIYQTLIEDIKTYLSEKYLTKSKLYGHSTFQDVSGLLEISEHVLFQKMAQNCLGVVWDHPRPIRTHI